jgi:predicted DCC family thiol-disulfide oxidoreductase YuxK
MPPVLLLYDATCRFCTQSARSALWLRPRGGLRLADVNEPHIQARYRITPQAAARAMHIVTPGGRVYAGAAAVRVLLRRSRWAWPFAAAWWLPGFPWLADHVYAWVADHRYLFLGRIGAAPECADGSCAIHLGRAPRQASGAELPPAH